MTTHRGNGGVVRRLWEDVFNHGEHDDVVVHRVTARATHLGELRHSGLGVIAPMGRPVEWDHIHIFHLANGRIISHWGTRNDVRLLQQIGVLAAPAGAWRERNAAP